MVSYHNVMLYYCGYYKLLKCDRPGGRVALGPDLLMEAPLLPPPPS